MPRTWRRASDDVKDLYFAFSSSATEEFGRRGKSGDLLKMRAKLLAGNILTAGLVNVYYLVRLKVGNPAKEAKKLFCDKLESISMNAGTWGLKQEDLHSWLLYYFGFGEEPEVTPYTSQEFMFGWQQFVDYNIENLEKLAKRKKMRKRGK